MERMKLTYMSIYDHTNLAAASDRLNRQKDGRPPAELVVQLLVTCSLLGPLSTIRAAIFTAGNFQNTVCRKTS
jgi:hypothetical protein